MQEVAIIGAGGFGREALGITLKTERYRVAFFIDPGFPPGSLIDGVPVFNSYKSLKVKPEIGAVIGSGVPQKRRQIALELEELKIPVVTIVHPSTSWDINLHLGAGVIICQGVSIGADVVVEDYALINKNVVLGHDVKVGKYTVVSPLAGVMGRVTLEEGVFIGVGASIIEKLAVGSWSIVGAGAVVIRSIPSGVTVAGVPAKVLA